MVKVMMFMLKVKMLLLKFLKMVLLQEINILQNTIKFQILEINT